MRWFVALEWEMTWMSRFGIWQPMQSLAGFLCILVSIGSLQLWLVWQVRHLAAKYAGASSRDGST